MNSPRVVCCGTTPALQRTLHLRNAFDPDVDVTRIHEVTERAGGKAVNAARAITCMGGAPHVFGFIGGHTGEIFAARSKQEPYTGHFIRSSSPTRLCQTLYHAPSGAHELVEEAGLPTPEEWGELFHRLEHFVKAGDVLCLSGSLPPGASPVMQQRLANIAASRSVYLIVDAVGPALHATLSAGPLMVKINHAELVNSTESGTDMQRMQQLRHAGAQNVLITRGPSDCLFVSASHRLAISLPKVNVRNPIGCGDTMTGVFAHQLAAGDSEVEAVRIAIGAALAQAETDFPAEFSLERALKYAQQLTQHNL